MPFAFLAALSLAAAAPAAPADDPAATFAALREVDGRMAAIAYRLTTANAALCRDRQPTPGWALHAIGQYDAPLRAQAKVSFGFERPVAVEAVVPGSPAAAAGIVPGDSLVALDGRDLPDAPLPAQASSAARDAAQDLIAGLPADKPLAVTLIRGGRTRRVTLPASPGCRSAFEVLLGPKMEASSDGRIVQVGVRFFARYSDEELAVVIGHELAHTILRHRARLDAAGVSRGLLAEVGRNGRLFRTTEDQADLLGMYLIRNAGWDPRAAVRFWRDHGGDVDGGLFRSRTHPSSKARAAALEAEIAKIPPDAPMPYLPPILAEADKPLQ